VTSREATGRFRNPRAGFHDVVKGVELSPERAARRRLLVFDYVDAVRAGDEDEADRLGHRIIELNERLFAEQLAEAGYMPRTVEGCIAVLDVAARIIESLAGCS
jgi:hypothetical protein